MGQLKPLLPWQGVPLIRYQVESLLEAEASPVIVVVGHRREEVELHIPTTAIVVVNRDYRQGRSTSVRAGLGMVPTESEAVVFLGVDQPRSPALLRQLFEAHRRGGALITRPTYQGEHGHPVIFAAPLLAELQSITEETQGLRAVMHRHASDVRDVAVESREVLLDLNRPEEYQEATSPSSG